MNVKKRPVLSISMLVSNHRHDTIEKCMESLVPLREAVPCELIIVDTGCTDGSVDIARKYADKVIQFTWCNDFSAARNAGLRECTGGWFLYLDDDEWFEDVTEIIEFFRGEGHKSCDALWYIQRNYDDFEGKKFVDTYVSRCVKLTTQTRFCGKIHEWLEPLPKMIKQTKAFVHHYGYVYKNEEERQKHLLRNLTLEEAAVKENPDDIRMCCQLIQEYRAAERYEDAEMLCRATLHNTKYEETNSFVQYLLSVLPRIYGEKGAYEKALNEYERLEREHRLLHQTKLMIYWEKAYLFGKLDSGRDVIRMCLEYLKEYDYVPHVGDVTEYPIMDFAQYQSETSRQKVARMGIAGCLKTGDFAAGEVLYAAIEWRAANEKAGELLLALLQCYLGSKNARLLTDNLKRALQIEGMEASIYQVLHSAYEQHPECRAELAEALESLNLRTGNFAFFHLLYTESKGITTEQDIADYYEKSDRKYDAEVVALFLGNTEKFSNILDSTSLELFTEAVSVLLAGKSRSETEKLWRELPDLEVCYPEEKKSFFYYASMVIAEKRLILTTEERRDAEQGRGAEQRGVAEQRINVALEKTENDAAAGAEISYSIRELLRDYIAAAKRYAESLYRPELLNAAGMTALPANLRFAYVMEQAMEQEADFKCWGDAVKRAAKEYPAMLPVVKALLAERTQRSRKEEQTFSTGRNTVNGTNGGDNTNSGNGSNGADSAKQELLMLAEQLKTLVRAQLAEGKTDEAKAILSELAVMLPEDEEVKELLKSINN